jgi:hypothetical protein
MQISVGTPVIFVFISLLVVALIYSSSSSVLAAKSPSPRDVCDVFSQGTCYCNNIVEELTASCCVITPGQNGKDIFVCEKCSINTDTGEYYNCELDRKSPTTGGANVPQGGGVLEQPPTPKKHGGIVPPKGGGVLEQPSSDQAKSGGNSGNKSK